MNPMAEDYHHGLYLNRSKDYKVAISGTGGDEILEIIIGFLTLKTLTVI